MATQSSSSSEAFYRQLELGLAEAYDYAAATMTTNMLAADAAEGIDAFLGKRPPVWTSSPGEASSCR